MLSPLLAGSKGHDTTVSAAAVEGSSTAAIRPAIGIARRRRRMTARNPTSRRRRKPASIRAGRPEGALLLTFLLRGPDLLAGLRLLHRDRLRPFPDQLEGPAHAQILLEELLAARLADLLERVVGLGVPVVLVAGRDLQRLELVLLGDLDVLRVRDRLEHGFALQGPLGIRASLLDHLLAGLALHLQVALRRHALP